MLRFADCLKHLDTILQKCNMNNGEADNPLEFHVNLPFDFAMRFLQKCKGA